MDQDAVSVCWSPRKGFQVYLDAELTGSGSSADQSAVSFIHILVDLIQTALLKLPLLLCNTPRTRSRSCFC